MKLRAAAGVWVVVVAVGAGARPGDAGQAPEARTPSACLEATREFQKARMKEAGLPMTAEKYQAVVKQKVDFAAGCLAALDPGRASSG